MRLGNMTSGQMKDILTRLSPSLRYDDVKNADIASIIFMLFILPVSGFTFQ